MREVLKKIQLKNAQSHYTLNACKAELKLKRMNANSETKILLDKIKTKANEILSMEESF